MICLRRNDPRMICNDCEFPIKSIAYYHEWCEASYCTRAGHSFCEACYVHLKKRSATGRVHCYDGYTDPVRSGRTALPEADSFWVAKKRVKPKPAKHINNGHASILELKPSAMDIFWS
jgi:hypothetical protein